jgi:peptidoglycan/xylan/chitin deacetylase (PgdA/CDA1 family)
MVLSATGVFRFGRWLSRSGIVALTYHRVLPDRVRSCGRRPANALFRAEFERQLDAIVREYHVIDGDDLRASVAGRRRLPPYSVLLTFDDGYANNYTEAFPVLQRAGVGAIFFLTAGLIGRPGARLWHDRLDAVLSGLPGREVEARARRHDLPPDVRDDARFRTYLKRLPRAAREDLLAKLESDSRPGPHAALLDDASELMTWNQVREMASAGMTIGSHGVSHQILSCASPEDVRSELRASRLEIEEQLGIPCWCFSYPNGEPADFRPADVDEVEAAGYECAVTQIPGIITARSGRFGLPRVSVPDTGDMRVFRSRITGVHRWLVPTRRLPELVSLLGVAGETVAS